MRGEAIPFAGAIRSRRDGFSLYPVSRNRVARFAALL
jgi:hypothetical protein